MHYVENRVRRKVPKYLKPCFQLIFIILFTIMDNLCYHLKDIFDNYYKKEHIIENFQEVKMGASLLGDFHSEFICLIFNFMYTLKMFIQEFEHKSMPHLQDLLNSGIELSSTISFSANSCLNIYK